MEGDGKAQESESATAISKDYSNRYIRSLDNHQRRQLVDQPRDINSQFMLSRSLNSLEKEYQTARARQLSSLSRVNPIEREMTSTIDSPIVFSEELGGQFTELSAANNEVPVSTTLFSKLNETDPEEEIQVIEPLPKTPPLCIDLDEESSSPVTYSSTSSTEKSNTSRQQQEEKKPNSIEICVGARSVLSNSRIVSAASEVNEREEKKSPTKSPLLLPNQNTANQVPVQSQTTVPVQALAPAASEANVNKETASVSVTENGSVPSFNLEMLQIEERESKARIAEIDGEIKKLQREREILTDRVFALKQKQCGPRVSSHRDTQVKPYCYLFPS